MRSLSCAAALVARERANVQLVTRGAVPLVGKLGNLKHPLASDFDAEISRYGRLV
jgi:hypothetical protein